MDIWTGFSFTSFGEWSVTSVATIAGAPAVGVEGCLHIAPSRVEPAASAALRGVASNVRYATKNEVAALRAVQEGLGRSQATRAALIPIVKSDAWWGLAQDERRAIFEEQSRHNSIGLRVLPQIARKLYHCRDLGEPFDFLTWFEFAPEDEGMFDDLVAALRATQEWEYVSREVDIRLDRAA